MNRRWAIAVAAIQLLVATAVVLQEEAIHWKEYGYEQRMQDRSGQPYTFVIDPKSEWGMSIDRWLDAREVAFHGVNLPVSLTIGWYAHPFDTFHDSLLGPYLLQATGVLRVRSRIILIDCLTLTGVALQWWLIGMWTSARVPLHRILRGLVIAMVAIAVVNATVTTLQLVSEPVRKLGSAVVDVPYLLALLCWLLLAIVGVLSTTSKVISDVRRHRLA